MLSSSCSRNGATEWWRGLPDLSVKKTFILPTGQPTTLTPCENKFGVRESNPASLNTMNKAVDIPEYDIFTKTKDDDKIFLQQMNDQFTKDSTGSWVSPLPFRTPRQRLPNNKQQALTTS